MAYAAGHTEDLDSSDRQAVRPTSQRADGVRDEPSDDSSG